MKGSLIIVGFFVLGVLLGRFDLLPSVLVEHDYSMVVLYVLMFLVGMSIGSDNSALRTLRQYNFKIILIPLGTIVGTYLGVLLISPLVFGRSLLECITVSSGFGYYSLSTIFINQYKGPELGTVSLICNILREIITLLAAPLMVRYFSPLAPISAGGATTMDTTLPVITKFSGKEFVIISIFHGFCVDLSVPFLVTFFASM